jgi:type IV fimbrial biogenesis protein FimT
MLTSRTRGFTIIEVLVVITVIGILLAVGLPSYAIWAQNLRIRSAAESVQNGLQIARATAIARNTQAILVFRNDGNGNCCSLSYFVYTVPNPGAPPADWQDPDAGPPPPDGADIIRRHNAADDAGGTATTFKNGNYMVTFSPLGATAPNPDGSNRLEVIGITSATSTDGGIRPLRIVINPGGSTRMCDPKVTDPADARVCPASPAP